MSQKKLSALVKKYLHWFRGSGENYYSLLKVPDYSWRQNYWQLIVVKASVESDSSICIAPGFAVLDKQLS